MYTIIKTKGYYELHRHGANRYDIWDDYEGDVIGTYTKFLTALKAFDALPEPPPPYVLTKDEINALSWLSERYESARYLNNCLVYHGRTEDLCLHGHDIDWDAYQAALDGDDAPGLLPPCFNPDTGLAKYLHKVASNG